MQNNLLVVAGEASGDQHGAELIAELRQLDPDLVCFGIGDGELEEQGVELLGRSSEVAVVGITEALAVLPRARRMFHDVLDECERRATKVALLIDFPEFNLRLARRLSRRGIAVVYYISPQIWAWRRGRVRTIARVVKEMLVLFPFEADFYRDHGVDAVHVGHPLVDQVPERDQVWNRPGALDGGFRVSLLPGSRASEVERLLPTLCTAAERLAERMPVSFQLIQASSLDPGQINAILAASSLEVEIVREDRFKAIADSHLALCASGTVTLEVGLLGTPMIVVYKVSGWTSFLARLLLDDLPHYSLVNLVAGQAAVPELLQDDAHPSAIASEAEAILGDPERVRRIRQRLGGLRNLLGEPGASRRAAKVVARRLAMAKESA